MSKPQHIPSPARTLLLLVALCALITPTGAMAQSGDAPKTAKACKTVKQNFGKFRSQEVKAYNKKFKKLSAANKANKQALAEATAAYAAAQAAATEAARAFETSGDKTQEQNNADQATYDEASAKEEAARVALETATETFNGGDYQLKELVKNHKLSMKSYKASAKDLNKTCKKFGVKFTA